MKHYKTCSLELTSLTPHAFIQSNECIFDEVNEATKLFLRITPMNPLYRSNGKRNKEAEFAFLVEETIKTAA